MYKNDAETFEAPVQRENVLAGTVGAFLFALAGGLIYFILAQVGYLAGISGLIAVVCAAKGYQVFAKRESKKGLIISVIMAILVIVLAWYCCLSLDVYRAYQEWYAEGEVDFTLTYFESLRIAYNFLGEPDLAMAYFKDLAIGLILCVIGSIGYIFNTFRRIKANAAPASAAAQPQYAPSAELQQNFTGGNEQNPYSPAVQTGEYTDKE